MAMISITVRHHNSQQPSVQARWAPCGANQVQVEYARNTGADQQAPANQENQDKQQSSQTTHHARSISLVINPKFNQNILAGESAPSSLARRRSLPRRLRRDWNRNCRLLLASQRPREPEPPSEPCPSPAGTPVEACRRFRQAGAWLREISDQFSK